MARRVKSFLCEPRGARTGIRIVETTARFRPEHDEAAAAGRRPASVPPDRNGHRLRCGLPL